MRHMFLVTLVGFIFSGGLFILAAIHPWWVRRKALRKLRKRG